jgi:FKBP-type peptidyl-prolyl cis-trans isomerase
VPATSFSVTSPTTITAVAPVGAAGVTNITVTTAGGTSAASAGNQFTYTLNDDSGMATTLPDLNSPNWQTQADGLKFVDVVTGSGTPVAAGASVTVFYSGWLTNGTVFDSRRSPSAPLQFSLNSVIQGWKEGLVGMKPGGIRLLYIPAALAYGSTGQGNVPPNADLVFEVKLISSP